MNEPARPLLRYHGGKWKLAPWIIEHFPPHRVYVEPFGGGGSVLLRKPRVYAEIYNDLDGEIVNVFRVARDQGDDLARVVALTPYSREEFHLSFRVATDELERARRTIVRSFMGFGGNLTRENRDQTPQRTGFRGYTATARGSTPASEWRRWPEDLHVIVDRLRGVIVEQREASVVMASHDGEDTLHYVDPPYVHSTRGFDAGGTHRGYRFEMDDAQHRELAAQLHALIGPVILSGYRCDLYDELFRDWHRVDMDTLADGARPRVECLWMNAASLDAQRQAQLPMEHIA